MINQPDLLPREESSANAATPKQQAEKATYRARPESFPGRPGLPPDRETTQ